RQHAIVDVYAFLRVELVDQLPHGGFRHQLIRVAMQHQAAAWTGGEEAEIVMVRRRREADPTGDLRPAHQQPHTDERPERIASDPQAAMARVDSLHPVKRSRCITDLTDATVVTTLATADTTKVKPHHRAAQLLKSLVHRVSDAIVHGSAV